MSLYKHVANKDDILDGLLELVVEGIDLPGPGEAWRPAMRRRALSARDVLRRHPWATALLQSRRNPGPATLRYYDAVLASLRGGGFPVPLAAQAFAVLDSYVYGFVVQEQSLPIQAPGELQEVTSDILEGFPVDGYPHLAEMAVEHVLRPGYSWSDQFGFGLDLILDGLERAVSRVT
jgi:hypothetical protein